MFQGLKKILKYFQTIQKTFTMLVFFDHDVGDQHRGGYKSVAPKMVFLRFCARSALLARTKFLGQPLITYKTFPSDRFSRIVVLTSKNTIVENGEYPPHPHTHTSEFQLYVLARAVCKGKLFSFKWNNFLCCMFELCHQHPSYYIFVQKASTIRIKKQFFS